MGKWVADIVLDGALKVIAQADRLVAVAGQPADFNQAFQSRLAEVEMTGGDFSFATGGVSGRQVIVGGKSGVTVQESGTADHVALLDVAGGRLLYVTTCPAQLLSQGASIDFDPWSVEIGAPQ